MEPSRKLSRRQKLLATLYRHPWTRAAIPIVRRYSAGMTLGVRVAAFDDQGQVLLLRHSYRPGWHLPGGGVDLGESAVDAAVRELREETGCTALETPELFGFYFNPKVGGRDHVALYVLRRFAMPQQFRPNAEIAEVGLFAPGSLPEGATRPTRARLAEILEQQQPAPRW
jgi:8-oxo-dGTP pyrophosphatase MutT (NUDIX family)